jgi:hypothetical protein
MIEIDELNRIKIHSGGSKLMSGKDGSDQAPIEDGGRLKTK